MKLGRRGFLTGALATTTGLAGCASESLRADGSLTTRRWSFNAFRDWTLHERNSTANYAYSKVADFTGLASKSTLERFELRDGDCGGVDCQTNRQRYERMAVGGRMNRQESYSISFFLPSNQSLGAPHTHIFQFFESGAEHVPLMVTIRGQRDSESTLDVTLGGPSGYKKFNIARTRDILGRWNTFDMDVLWGFDGFYRMRLNGETVVDQAWPTMLGTDRNLNIFHYGLYMGELEEFRSRFGTVPTRTIFFSEVAKYV